jgi:hypothetical protein
LFSAAVRFSPERYCHRVATAFAADFLLNGALLQRFAIGLIDGGLSADNAGGGTPGDAMQEDEGGNLRFEFAVRHVRAPLGGRASAVDRST